MRKDERKITFKDVARMYGMLKLQNKTDKEIMSMEIDMYVKDEVGGVR